MNKIKELKALLEKLIQRMKGCVEMVNAAKEKGDEAGLKTAQAAYELAKKERDETQKALEEAMDEYEKELALQKALERADSYGKTKVPAGVGMGAGQDDQTKAHDFGSSANVNDGEIKVDHKKNILDHEDDIFYDKYMRGKSLSANERKLLTPVNQKLIENNLNAEGHSEEAVVKLPTRLWAKILKAKIEEKALPMTSGDGAGAGGRAFLHWPDYSDTLQQLPPDDPSFVQRVTKRMMSGDRLFEPVLDQDSGEFGGVVVSRNTEGADANETEIDIKQTLFQSYPLDAYTEMTNRLLRLDRVGLEAELAMKFGGALERRLNFEIVHGTGTAGEQCLGLRLDDDVNTVARQVALQVGWVDLLNLEHALRVAVRRGAQFALDDTVLRYLKEIQRGDDSNDKSPLFSATTGTGLHDRLDNFPFFTGIDMTTLGGNGDVIFGNFAHYWLVFEMEAVFSRSAHFQFKKGVTAFRIDSGAGGRALHPTAFSVLVSTAGS